MDITISAPFAERRRFLLTAGSTVAAASVLGLTGQSSWAQAATAADGQMNAEPAKDLPKAVSLPPMQEDKTEKSEMPVQLGRDGRLGLAIVGLGRLSLEEIMPALATSKRCRVTALVSGDPDKARQVAAMYDVPETSLYNYETFDQLRDNPEVHAVYIVLPNALHRDFVIRAAKAGKHVLCEKPMATSVVDCQTMIDACKAANRLLMIAYRIQYEPQHRQVMAWVREGAVLGKIKLIDMSNCQNQSKENTHQWRHVKALAGGGALPDIGLYCLNTARFLLGEEPVEVSASQYSTEGDPRFVEVEEAMLWQMRFPSGVRVQCTSSYATFGSNRYRVLGDTGWADMDPAFSYEGLQLKRSRIAEDTRDFVAPGIEQITTKKNNQFALEMDHFAECVATGKQPWTPGEEGLQDQRIMEAIYESARSGKPVQLTPIQGTDVLRGSPPSKT
ncbi:Gfo/Idh/MocA family oxidoreductase [Pseudomonas sp. CCI4.2]|uniref:Gfo/Idh/MocA family protein n=1 Tax=Pseudomonas sp. CCI4.2 TaxID=3048620 RepID=UPI002AC89605|nr:Gfo/Idh/MocA family oxidoreductase [Pseudomonas sp. CCI4.2]MEB0092150.1 Gfo/Idh/MocA family oxidoreductase [Pseudomonas sp. CCI4.2]WPX52168.1 Gfo/Idh/MocA family oxidoreductase [Pseudomonas sp. CCI4.2]